ncbi:hypothetical protein EXIGLDRAFT_724898 [Exidia glandulosa HHB12029]|uniref:DUF6533 domain-containing protein n=1 Tax=Exidia glandulosa HHB12029 TaxID=1314781 RepID=A0A165E879_EXIGL|nr:hypothetical protein EXIGLDRAFT_724898 [Exidia glandulosa HHB12029]
MSSPPVSLPSLRANAVSESTHRICEHLETFSDEIELVWKTRTRFGKVLYIVIRYGTWLLVIMPMYESVTTVGVDLCSPIMMTNTYAVVFGIALTQVVLNRGRWLLVFLSTMLIAVHATETVLMSLFFVRARRQVVYVGHDFNIQRHCGIFYDRSLFLRDGLQTPLWVLISAFDLVIMGLTAIKAVQHVRRGSSTLVTTLYRDGLLYFVAVFVISLLYLILTFALPTGLDVTFTLQIQAYLYAILACRVMLHLRAAAFRPALDERKVLVESSQSRSREMEFRVSTAGRERGRDETAAWFGGELGRQDSTSSILVIGMDDIPSARTM